MKERTIKELLTVIYNRQDLFQTGLCCWAYSLYNNNRINSSEYDSLLNYIESNRPSKYSSLDTWKRRNSAYYWKIGNIKPRLKWIKKHSN
jgi:hypothetical protein